MKKSEKQINHKHAKLVLEDGSEYHGWSFGRARSIAGEVVFTTSMTGYPQLLTDPAICGRIPVFTYPLVGNCGVHVNKNGEAFLDEYGIPVQLESEHIEAAGLVISELCEQPSHYSGGSTLASWFEKENKSGIYGVDTRALAIRLRERGAMRGKILVDGSRDITLDSGAGENHAQDVSHNEVKTFTPKNAKMTIAVVDCGAKAGVFRALLARNAKVVRVPWNHDLAGIEYDGLFLSGGPGDPRDCGKTIAVVRKLFTQGKPIFGTGLGSLIMALAAGADTYRLPNWHCGVNQPCIENGTKRCYITSQSHGYAIRGESIPRGWETWFTNANDGTIEGIRSKEHSFSSVMFYPTGCPGPADTEFVLDQFVQNVKGAKK